MAAKHLESDDIKNQELNDMITCCICTEVYTDPKDLPCLHTFCMKCLQQTGFKSNKGPREEMPCPICRRLFTIPPEGFPGLRNNFFIEKLIQASNASGQSAKALCDACVEETIDEKGKEIKAADTFCVDCNQRFCEECSRHHRKFKLTKQHRLIPVARHESGQVIMSNLSPSACRLHQQRILDVYCTVCKTVVCNTCFVNDHRNHEGSHVDKCVGAFRKQIEGIVKTINECISKAKNTQTELLMVKEYIPEKVEKLEFCVEMRKLELRQFADKHATSLVHGLIREDELKQLADEHAASLLQGLYLKRQSKLKEIQTTTDDIDAYLTNLETFKSYCEKINDKGSASDICGAFCDLSVRALELQDLCQMVTGGDIQAFNFCFRKSEFEEFLEHNCENVIGVIEDEGASKPKTGSTQGSLAEHIHEIHLLRKEIENERADKESLRLENEQLRYNINKEVQATTTLTQELNKERANYNAHVAHVRQKFNDTKMANSVLQVNIVTLKQELDKERIAKNSLQANNDKLKQELDQERIAKNSLQTNNGKLRQELDKKSLQTDNDQLKQELYKEKIAKKSLQTNNDKMKQELHRERVTRMSLQTNNDKLIQELGKEKAANNSLQTHDQLKQELDKEKTANKSLQADNGKLKQELDNEKRANNLLQDNSYKLKHEHDAVTLINNVPQLNNDKLRQELDGASNEKLKQELDSVKVIIDSQLTKSENPKQEADNLLRAHNDTLLKELHKEKLASNSPEANSSKPAETANVYRTTLLLSPSQVNADQLIQKPAKPDKPLHKTDPDSVEAMKAIAAERERKAIQRLTMSAKESFVASDKSSAVGVYDFIKSIPDLVRTINTRAAVEEKKQIHGLTILDKELFVVNDKSSEVEVYDTTKFSFSRRWSLKEIIDPTDIVSSDRDKCLYIFNYKGPWKSKEILRVDPNGNLIKSWSTGHDWGWGLSVTHESNIILAIFEKQKLNEYSPDGQLMHKINLSTYADIIHPLHAIKLTSGHFLVSHGDYGDDLQRVCEVDADGKLTKSFRGKRGSTLGQMNGPFHLGVDRNDFVMVADRRNSRVLLLDSELELKREILAKDDKLGLRFPQRILLDESNGRLFVADNKLNSEGRVLIFKFK